MSLSFTRLAALMSLAPAFAPQVGAQELASSSLAPLALDTVVTDVASDGTVWASGPTWKMRVGSNGAAFYPAVGPRVERSLPLEFGPATLSVNGHADLLDGGVPQLDGSTASIDRGAVVESYHFSKDQVEQTFLIESLPARGELVLTIPLATELVFRGHQQGLVFEHVGVGEVRYGDATILDADGRRVDVASDYTAAGIEVRVPAGFVAAARLPLLIDPVVGSTMTIDAQSNGTSAPDVSYDATTDDYIVVYERHFSSTDTDLLANRLTSAGTNLGTISIEGSDLDTTDPSVANNGGANQFLVVWRKEPGGVLDEIEIQGRLVSASSGSVGGVFEISVGSDNESNPIVGGTNAAGIYFVAWQENPVFGGGGENIAGRTVNTSAVVGSKLDLGVASEDERNPSINRHTFDDLWIIVWERDNGGGDNDIRGARVRTAGLIQGDHGLVTATSNDRSPVVVGLADDDYVLLWSRVVPGVSGSNEDVFGLRESPLISTAFNLTDLENLSPLDSSDQTPTSVTFDGNRILYVYESFGTPRAASMFFPTNGNAPIMIEPLVNIFGTKNDKVIVSRNSTGGPVGRSLIVADSGPDIVGIFFDSLTQGGVTVVQTGCGGVLEPSLTAQSTAAICEPFQMTLAGFDSALLVIGQPTSLPLCPGQGGCILGATPTIFIATSNGVKSFNLPCDPTVLGVTVAVTGVEFVAGGNLSGSCAPPVVPQAIRTSDTLVIDFQ